MENSNLKDLIEKYLSAYNTFNIDGMIGVLNENIHFRNISKGEVNSETKGIQEFRTLAEQSIQVFSQRRQVIKNITFTGDKAEVDIDYEGILSSDLPNGMKAGWTVNSKSDNFFKGCSFVLDWRHVS
ncbi:nuclear transport factor 2 family protein [Paenibacillus brasilensis]|uniref:SnoaL-like domain-containing protein n=1 Tax=Paenibacillus brasilensis TaxID=128574 RepID=A0ABU0L683_9BACL|nr:nuclear transport factor 2 family protein [Paenibacillus brasilensis]MDQ0496813.1 hypothetical protein [Paenibacillus brasilensis]